MFQSFIVYLVFYECHKFIVFSIVNDYKIKNILFSLTGLLILGLGNLTALVHHHII